MSETEFVEKDGIVYKKIKKIDGMRNIAPPIIWGEEYESWPIEKRLDRAQKVASAMNHAADILQKNRDECLGLIADQKEQLEHVREQYLKQGDLLNDQMQKENKKQQELNKRIVELTTENAELQVKLKKLGYGENPWYGGND